MRYRLAWLPLLLLLAASAHAGDAYEPVYIALIIDDLGERLDLDRRVSDLPVAVTCAVLPFTPHGREMAERCHRQGKEVMLHMPMEADNGANPGPGALTVDMHRDQVEAALAAALADLPHVRGVNNHMGSRFTRDQQRMSWTMQALARHGGLYFIDSRTSHQTVAAYQAALHGIPQASRHIFLDHDIEPHLIERQFRSLLLHAFRHGHAIGIGHPYPETLALLERVLPRLAQINVHVVPVSELLARTRPEERSPQLWEASLSPSPTAAKSSKP